MSRERVSDAALCRRCRSDPERPWVLSAPPVHIAADWPERAVAQAYRNVKRAEREEKQ